jgi:hypothetical protein
MKDIAAQILNVLNDWDAPAAEAVVYAQVNAALGGRVLVSEFDDAMTLCQTQRWITGLKDPTSGTMWSITNKGRARRHE